MNFPSHGTPEIEKGVNPPLPPGRPRHPTTTTIPIWTHQPKHLKKQFKDICDDTIDKQCEYWLKSFVKEFEGRVPEILELAEEFKAYLPDEADVCATSTSSTRR